MEGKKPFYVIGAGVGRTGTESLKKALEIIYKNPCYHTKELRHNGENHSELWYEYAARGFTNIDWDLLFKNYVAIVDAPGCFFVEELMKKYPEAKVILTTRDPERWYKSHSILVTINGYLRFAAMIVPKFCKQNEFMYLFFYYYYYFLNLIDRLNFFIVESTKRSFRYPFQKGRKKETIEDMLAHNEKIRQIVPKDKLLEFQVQQGWDPLCKFLGVEVPNEPFPHTNTSKEITGKFKNELRNEVVKFIVTPLVIVGAISWFFLKRK